jgi:hypothetical protein
MTRRTTTTLAWALAIFSLVVTIAELWLLLASPEGLPLTDPDRSAIIDYLEWLFALVVGTLIAWKRPANIVGWLMLGYVSSRAFVGLLFAYAERGVVIEPGSLPLAEVAVWLGSWVWVVHFIFLPLILLHFPSGRLPSPRWRWVAWCCGLPAVLMAAAAVGWRGVPAEELIGLLDSGSPGAEWAKVLTTVSFVVILAVVLLSIVSLFVRFRRSRADERQQLKWVLLAAGVLLVSGIWDTIPYGPDGLKAAFSALAFASVPASMGVAILRYRLYDIDRIINRAIVYGVVTGVVVAVYSVGVVVLPGAVADSPIVVAAFTLAMAALFRPIRRAVQGVVDRRFYRSRYDAARTVEAFGQGLRQGTDLDQLRGQLLGAVGSTLHPSHASVWLRARNDLGTIVE